MNLRSDLPSQVAFPTSPQYTGVDRRSSGALSQLSRQFNHACTTAVDPLQIAAALESGGITDRIARDVYGLPDVFAVAEELFRSVPRRLKARAEDRFSSQRWQEVRELSHGLLYGMPGLAYPAVAAAIGPQPLLIGLVLSTAAAWVWGLGISWLAYRLIGRGFRDEATRLLLRLSLLGILGVEVGAWLFSLFLGIGSGTVYLATGLMAYQMAASILIIYRLESWLFGALSLGVLLNLGFLTSHVGLNWALGGTLVTVGLAVGLAFWAIRRVPKTKSFRPTLSPQEVRRALPVFAYGALSAALVLWGNAHNMLSQLDLSLSISPLVLGMGVLEWQARRFQERSRALLHRTRRISEFLLGVRTILLDTLTSSMAFIALLSAALALVLSGMGQFSVLGAVMLTAHLVLGGVFFMNFILLAHSRYRWILGSFGGALLFFVVSSLFLVPPVSFLLTAILLAVAIAIGLRRSLGQVSYYQ